MPLFLTSLVFEGLSRWLSDHHATGPVTLIGNASRDLPDRRGIVAEAGDELRSHGRRPRVIDVTTSDVRRLPASAAIVMTGGDPFRLLADLKTSGADRMLLEAHERGVPIAGQSAGAIVCGPDLGPITVTSPFPAPADLALTGLALTRTLVLPHHGRDERSQRHRQASLSAGPGAQLEVLWDDEVLIEDGERQIRRGDRITRTARADDATAVGEVFYQAALAGWRSFLGEERLGELRRPASLWAKRIAAAGDSFLVTEDDAGLVGFVYWRPTSDPRTGEVDLLYTHPRAWGDGSGRRLLERATWHLLCEGYREAVLWTEARNERALAVYRANGWRQDGGIEEREFAGRPIRNLRHRLDLTRYAGGL